MEGRNKTQLELLAEQSVTSLNEQEDKKNLANLRLLVDGCHNYIVDGWEISTLSITVFGVINLDGKFLKQVERDFSPEATHAYFFTPKKIEPLANKNCYVLKVSEGTGYLVDVLANALNEHGIDASTAPGPRLIVIRNEAVAKHLDMYTNKIRIQTEVALSNAIKFYDSSKCNLV